LNEKFLTGWSDKDNKPVNHYLDFAREALSIPEAHQMVTQYSVLDKDKKSIILLRPYQIHAIQAVKQSTKDQKSGYIWHTTGARVIIVTGCINVLVTRISEIFIENDLCIA